MSMRVIAGTARGRRLDCPPGTDVRPAPEMARAAIFNILRDEVDGAAVLDLFAGVGSVGIEALSRGAARAVFVERSRRHAEYLQLNLTKTQLADGAEVLVRDAFRTPDFLAARGDAFDIIYVGPPFPLWRNPADKAALLELMERLAEQKVLKPAGCMIVQSDVRDVLPETTPRLCATDLRQYGRNRFIFYAHAAASGGRAAIEGGCGTEAPDGGAPEGESP